MVDAFSNTLRHTSPTTGEEANGSASPLSARKPRTRAPSVMDMNFLVNDADVEPGDLASAQHQSLSTTPSMATPSPEPVAAAQPSPPIMINSLAESAKVCRLVTRERRKPNSSANDSQVRENRVPVLQPAPSAVSFKTRSRQRTRVAQQQAKTTATSPTAPASPPSSLVLLTPVASPRGLNQQAQALPITMAMAMQALPAVRKRSRINTDQLAILNAVFSHTFFPTTEIRLAIARETGLSARTVQVWFQNRRQQWRARNGSPPAVGGEATRPEGDGGETAANGVPMEVENDQAGKPPPVKRVMIKATRGRPRLEDSARPPSTTPARAPKPQPVPPAAVVAAPACARCSPPPAGNGATAAATSEIPNSTSCGCSSPDPTPSQLPVHIAGWPASSSPPAAHHLLLNYRPFRHARVVTIPDANGAKTLETDSSTRPDHTPPATPRAGPVPSEIITTRPTPYPFPTRSSSGVVPVTVPAANAAARRLALPPVV
ncbi:hypothetical protein HDU87_003334 [Geranomyces variabilis]|uniref:Homeobox domain-containing protein n=1 Tax=Geranomyces variabilis TaxID=109894 RepID=A0AAD5TKY7_9FUNG|nr:hypothetical protein HDU87_003334 [Geranomyces variabilis]